MLWSEIKSELEYNRGYFPRAALEAAIAQRDEVIPFLLDELVRHARDPAALAVLGESYFLHIYAMYLLAQFHEARAHADILTLVGQPGEYAFEILGDAVTEDLYAILAQTHGDDLSDIQRLIENTAADAFVRGAGLRALAALVAAGEYPRAELIEYLRGLFKAVPRDRTVDDYFLPELINTACHIQPGELIEEIRNAFAVHRIDHQAVTMKDVERALKRSVDAALEMHSEREPLDIDAITRLQGWACFHPQDDAHADDDYEAETYVRETAKIGRNDPCPCGSGKKYKRCCGAST